MDQPCNCTEKKLYSVCNFYAVISIRCNIAVPSSFYESEHMRRKLGPNWQKKLRCHTCGQKLFNIALDKVVVDELHLMLILEVVDWDDVRYCKEFFWTFSISDQLQPPCLLISQLQKRTVHHNELTCRSVPVFFVTYMSHNTSKQHMNFMFVTKLTHLS